MKQSIEERSTERYRFLDRLYEESESQSCECFDSHVIGKELGFSDDSTKRTCGYLENEGLIEIMDESRTLVRITHKGIKKVEIMRARAKRFSFLKKLYDKTNGETHRIVECLGMYGYLGFGSDGPKIVDYLRSEGLIKSVSLQGISITHLGIKEIEEALENPDKPTEHFLSFNQVINYGTLQVQNVQGSGNVASQASSVESLDLQALQSVLAEILTRVSDMASIEQDQMCVEADTRSALEQIKSPEPDTSIIKTLVKKLIGTLTAIGTQVAAEYAKRLAGLS